MRCCLLLGPRDRRLVITQGAALPWRDRSSDRNGQHHAALETTQRTLHAHVVRSDQGPACIC